MWQLSRNLFITPVDDRTRAVRHNDLVKEEDEEGWQMDEESECKGPPQMTLIIPVYEAQAVGTNYKQTSVER
jgi:hypothetical protein